MARDCQVDFVKVFDLGMQERRRIWVRRWRTKRFYGSSVLTLS
jgi:hypothetical protein